MVRAGLCLGRVGGVLRQVGYARRGAADFSLLPSAAALIAVEPAAIPTRSAALVAGPGGSGAGPRLPGAGADPGPASVAGASGFVKGAGQSSRAAVARPGPRSVCG